MKSNTLRANLEYEPMPLKFGTSGRRGQVAHLTQLEIYINALAELEYLLSMPVSSGGIQKGDPFYFAHDLRPSSTQFVPLQGGRGEIAQAVERAIQDAGLCPINLGALPTPALTYFALQQGKGSIMVTGSHIPFDRNGYKTNSSIGELLKQDEAPINSRAEIVRQRIYAQPFAESIFNGNGLFKEGHRELSPPNPAGRLAYLQRYAEFFTPLRGYRLLVYQHSAVGRDLLVEILQQLGAEAIPAGRSETFVPIDTENIDAEQLAAIQSVTDRAIAEHGSFHAVISTDGDSDRPLILGLTPSHSSESKKQQVRFFSGDLVGMVVADFLKADAVVVPISCNDAIDMGSLKDRLEPKTRIGSPYVVAGMQAALRKGRKAVCGWEANGGFLTGSDFERNGRILKALPTRDALLPILGVLAAMDEKKISLVDLFSQLPHRFSRAALLRDFPRAASLRILERFSPENPGTRTVTFASGAPQLLNADGAVMTVTDAQLQKVETIRKELETCLNPGLGFGKIARLDYTDGLRIHFDNREVAHIRPSGNADELRIYAVADAYSRAEAIARLGVEEPNGLLRQLEKMVQ